MIPAHDLLIFAAACLALVLTPGPNMIYLISRSIVQGAGAGLTSLGGVVLGFVTHMLLASLGLSAVLLAVPVAYTILKLAGAAYLLWMAWQSVRPGSKSLFEVRQLKHDSGARLFRMGFFTSVLNPKIAVFYLALLPQFVRPEHGSALTQSLLLGFTQILISFNVNLLIFLSAARVAAFFAGRPTWLNVQKYVMGAVLGGLAVRLALEKAR